MNTEKELLIKLRNYIITKQCFVGMCASIKEMLSENLIDEKERNVLLWYLNSNKPIHVKCGNNSQLWFNIGCKISRLDWLDNEIEKL